MKQAFKIFGCSDATISMLLETLSQLFGDSAEVEIIYNIPVSEDLPVCTREIQPRKRMHDECPPDSLRKCTALMGVTRPEIKRLVYGFFEKTYGVSLAQYRSLIYPSAIIASSAEVGSSATVGPSVVVAPYGKIGAMVSINRQVGIGHHTVVGDFASLQAGCNVASECRIGDDVLIGMGANVINGIEIGQGSLIGAGSVVTRSVPAKVVAYGVPCRVVRERSP